MLRISRYKTLVTDPRRAVCEELDQLRATHNGRTRHEIVLVEPAPLHAWRTHVDHPAGLGEVFHEFFERGETLFTDIVGIAFLRQPHGLGAQKYQRLLVRSDRRIRDDERHRRLVW